MSKLTPQELPSANLGELSSPAPRGRGLASLVNSPTVDEVPEAPAPPRSRQSTAEPEEPAPATSAPVRRRAGRPGAPRTRAKPVSAVYVSPGVKQRFDAYRHKEKATSLQVVLEAISSRHDELDGIISDAMFNTAPVNPLFPADPNAVRYVGGGSVQISFSPTPEQEEVLDRIGRQLGFETRSTWIAPVLNAFLPGRKDTQPAR